MKDLAIQLYKDGLTIAQIASKIGCSNEIIRRNLKNKVQWRKKYLSDLTSEEINDILKSFDKGISIDKIAQFYDFSPPAISRLLRANRRIPIINCKKYDILRIVPFNKKHKDFIIGHLLGSGCLYKDSKKSSYKMTITHNKKQEEYFHWKIAIMDPFINCWRENVDKKGNSILHTTTICHKEFNRYAKLFYDNQRIKHIPHDISNYITPFSLAIWIMDSGNLNVNIRIATINFTYNENIILRDMFKSIFDIRSKVMEFKYKNKLYYQLSLNKRNSQILSNIIREFVIDSMKYKILPPFLND